MASKKYIALFVDEETKIQIKTKASKLGFPSMVGFLKALSVIRIEELRKVLSK